MLVLVGRVHFVNTGDFMDPSVVAETAMKIVGNTNATKFGVFAHDVSTFGLREHSTVDLAAASYLFLGKDKTTIARGFAQRGEWFAKAGKEGNIAIYSGTYKSRDNLGFVGKTSFVLKAKSHASDQSLAEIRNGVNFKALGKEGAFVLLGLNDHFDPTDQNRISLCGNDRVSFRTLSSVLASRDVSYSRSFGSKLGAGESWLNKIKLGTNNKKLKKQITEQNQDRIEIPFIDEEIDENI